MPWEIARISYIVVEAPPAVWLKAIRPADFSCVSYRDYLFETEVDTGLIPGVDPCFVLEPKADFGAVRHWRTPVGAQAEAVVLDGREVALVRQVIAPNGEGERITRIGPLGAGRQDFITLLRELDS